MPKIADAIDNSADILDSRDVIARIDYLESERETIAEALDDVPPLGDDEHATALAAAQEALADWEEEEGAELRALKALADEASGSADWPHGEALIRDSYFEDYARELAEDIGAMRDSDSWPYTCIDWEKAARELQYDYTSVDFAGVTYWIRS